MRRVNPYGEYKRNEISTASQNKLILMLYDGAIKHLKLAEHAIEEKDIENKNEHLKKAQDIISEFMVTLNFEQGGEVAESLYLMYDYMYNKLIKSNINNDIDGVVEIRKQLQELRSTWAQI